MKEALEQHLGEARVGLHKCNKVFVYGTLRQGEGNHRLLSNSKLVNKGKTVNKYCMTTNGCPFVNKYIQQSNIIGEVYEVPNVAEMYNLDMLESHPNWYYREVIQVRLDDGKIVDAWIYFNDDIGQDVVNDGDYVEFENDFYYFK